MFCTNCGEKLENDEVKFCPYCGKSTQSIPNVPTHERASIEKNNARCKVCGAEYPANVTRTTKHVILLILCLLMGWFGIPLISTVGFMIFSVDYSDTAMILMTLITVLMYSCLYFVCVPNILYRLILTKHCITTYVCSNCQTSGEMNYFRNHKLKKTYRANIFSKGLRLVYAKLKGVNIFSVIASISPIFVVSIVMAELDISLDFLSVHQTIHFVEVMAQSGFGMAMFVIGVIFAIIMAATIYMKGMQIKKIPLYFSCAMAGLFLLMTLSWNSELVYNLLSSSAKQLLSADMLVVPFGGIRAMVIVGSLITVISTYFSYRTICDVLFYEDNEK